MSLSVLIFFAIIFALVFAMRLARIGALVAFLFAGILSGPYMMNLFELTDTWTFLGELGIMFLWFNIGLEINMRRLWEMRRTIFGFGAAQVMMVAVMLFPILSVFTSWSVMAAMMVAMLLAMSSTSEDLQLMADRNQLGSPMGRQTFSILLFQDLFSIPLLAMLPVFAGRSINLGAAAIDVLVTSVTLVVAVVVIGRLVLNPLMKLVARLKSRELFLLAVMLNIVVWAVLIDLLGLPAGLGAFLAGMLMSETIYRHQVSAEISPYAMLFLAMFFISLGMGLNLPFLVDRWYWILLGLGGLIAVKFIAIYMVARVRNVPEYEAAPIALILAQGGEFGLLMLQTIKLAGLDLIPAAHQEILMAVIILSIMTTPILMALYDLARKSGRLFGNCVAAARPVNQKTHPAVVICGFGRVGQIVARLLASRGVEYIAVDLDVNSVMMGREHGYNVMYGNTRNADVLRELGLSPRGTRAVVIALDNAATAHDTILNVKSIAPRVKIFARARNLADSRALVKDGATKALPETIESSFSLAYGVLRTLGMSDNAVDAMLDKMRADGYAELLREKDDRD